MKIKWASTDNTGTHTHTHTKRTVEQCRIDAWSRPTEKHNQLIGNVHNVFFFLLILLYYFFLIQSLLFCVLTLTTFSRSLNYFCRQRRWRCRVYLNFVFSPYCHLWCSFLRRKFSFIYSDFFLLPHILKSMDYAINGYFGFFWFKKTNEN